MGGGRVPRLIPNPRYQPGAVGQRGVTASPSTRDRAATIAACVEAWSRGDWAATKETAAALGFSFDRKVAASLDAELTGANGKRSSRLLDPAGVLGAMSDARLSPLGIGVRHGGLATVGKMVTTVALVVQHGKRLSVGVTNTGAISGSPGRAPAWVDALGPWRKKPEDNLEGCRRWATQPERVSVSVVAIAPVAPSEHRELLSRVLEAPDDEAPRGVYADWLLEQGDPLGEFITLQCADRAQDAPRITALQAADEARWTAQLKPLISTATFRRGFVEAVTMKARTFIDQAAKLFTLAPIREVTLGHLSASLMNELAAAEELSRLNGLCLGYHRSGGTVIGPDGFAALMRSGHLGQLISLGAYCQLIGPAGLAALGKSAPHGLASLRLFGNRLGASGLAPISRLNALRVLDLSNNGLGDEGARAVARLSGLSALMLCHNNIGPSGAKALAQAKHLATLEQLELTDNPIKDAGLTALVGSPYLSRLRKLGLGTTQLTPRGLVALARSPAVKNLRELDLSANLVGEEGARILLDSPHLGSLRRLLLATKGIKEGTQRELEQRFGREPSRG